MTAPSIEKIRQALQRMHRFATGETTRPYMQIPANPQEDADLILSAAITELEHRRGQVSLGAYQADASRTLARKPLSAYSAEELRLKLAVMGLGVAGEAGEVVELIKKHVGHGHELPPDGHELPPELLKKELGDVLWYVAAIATLAGFSLDEVAQLNIAKLKARYPEGFSEAASKNRGAE